MDSFKLKFSVIFQNDLRKEMMIKGTERVSKWLQECQTMNGDENEHGK